MSIYGSTKLLDLIAKARSNAFLSFPINIIGSLYSNIVIELFNKRKNFKHTIFIRYVFCMHSLVVGPRPPICNKGERL